MDRPGASCYVPPRKMQPRAAMHRGCRTPCPRDDADNKDVPAMPPSILASPPAVRSIASSEIQANSLSVSIYGDPSSEIDDLLESVRSHGILVPLVVARDGAGWEVVSGHRRLACARSLGLVEVPCE